MDILDWKAISPVEKKGYDNPSDDKTKIWHLVSGRNMALIDHF